MDAETRTLVRAGLDASAYTAGAAQVAAANERIVQSGEGVVRTQEAAEGAARRKSTAIDRLQASLDQTYRAQQQFERAQTQINAAVERGSISAQRAAELQDLARQKYLGTAQAAAQAAEIQARADEAAARAAQEQAAARERLRGQLVPLIGVIQQYEAQIARIAEAEQQQIVTAAEASAARVRAAEALKAAAERSTQGLTAEQRAAELAAVGYAELGQRVLAKARASEQATQAALRHAEAEQLAARSAAAQQQINQNLGVRAPRDAENYAARQKDLEAYSRELDQLRARYVPLAAVQQAYATALEEIARAERVGAITAQEAAAARLQQTAVMQRQAQALSSGAVASSAFAAANDNASRSTSRFGQVAGQAGFQVQDFAGQVMAGGNALVAFGQQGSQLLGIFGTGGAIAGAVLTVGILAYQLLAARDASEDLAKSQDELGRAMQRSIEFFETAAERVARLAQESRSAIVAGMLPEMLRLEREMAARERALELLQRDREERIRANANLPGFNPDTVLREPIERARRELAELREQLANFERERERVLTAPSGADRDEVARTIDRLRQEREREAERAAREAERRGEVERREAERRAQAEERESERARQAREREEERARQQQEREAQRARDREEAATKQSTDEIVRYGADAFADMFDANSRGWKGMLDTFEATFRRTFARMAAEAIIRPIIQPIVAGIMGAPGGDGSMMGGLTSMLGLSGLGSSVSGALGLGGVGAGVSGLLNTTVIGASGPIGPTISGAAMGGGASLGQLLGGAGLGFGAGTLLNGLVGGNQTNGMIGSGGGALAGAVIGSMLPGVGTVIGGLIGGAGGGLLGGMFGPRGNRPGFYNIGVEAGADGMLAIASAGGKRADQQLAALRQQTQQQVAALNAQMAALGLRAQGRADLGANVAGAAQIASLGDVTTQFRLTAADARIQGAIDRVGGGTFAGGLQAAQSADALIRQLDAFAQAARDAADPLGAVARQFDGVRETAQRLGFGLDEVSRAQERAVREATARLMAPVAGSLDGLADYARSLRTANDNTGNPLSRLAAAEAEFERLSGLARGGDATAIGRFQQAAEQFRGLSRDVFGTGQGFAANEGRIVAALEAIGNVGADALTASVLASVQREQTDTLVSALARLQDEVKGLRREVQQAQRNPLAA